MQIAQQGGGAPDIAAQLRKQRSQHTRILLLRTVGFWWHRILLVILVGYLGASLLGQVAMNYPTPVFLGLAASVVVFLAIRRVELGFVLIVILATAFFPKAISLKSLNIYPSVPMFVILFIVVLIQVVFRVRKPVWPSFWTVWPIFGLVGMAIVSNIMVQLTWTVTVPHKINSNPVIYDEVLGVALFCVPWVLITVTTVILTKKEYLIQYVQRALLILSFLAALLVAYEFRRIGGDVYSFRYTTPTIFWMSLRALATLLCLGSIVAYANFLYATRGRDRLIYGIVLVLSLVSVYFTLENSWWLEAGVALFVMTIVYSRRLLVASLFLVLPLIPLIQKELAKLAATKSVDSLRFVIWQDALRVWSKQPLLGVGPGNFWAYDQRFTNLPTLLRDFNKTGLGVAHNGYLQVLGELGPLGLLFHVALIFVIILASARLIYRSRVKQRRVHNIFGNLLHLIGLDMTCKEDEEQRRNRILGLLALGLICGASVADFTSGFFFLPPRQLGGFNDLSQIVIPWVIWGCVMYKDQVWRMTQKGIRLTAYH